MSQSGLPQLPAIQSAIQQLGFDGWLLYDFRGLNVLARRVLGLATDAMLSRRWFYFIPARGEPRKLVHRIEPGALDAFPGSRTIYLRWQELEAGVAGLVQGSKRVAMEYVPRNANPYVSRVDAGTVELVRSCGPEVVPSGDLVQMFEACWGDEQWAMHLEAARHTRSAYDVAWKFHRRADSSGRARSANWTCSGASWITSRNTKWSATTRRSWPSDRTAAIRTTNRGPGPKAMIGENQFVLIDLWAKLDRPNAVYSDLTWTGFVGHDVPARYSEIFNIVARGARCRHRQGARCVRKPPAAAGLGGRSGGARGDRAAGYGEAFCHRTGHSIGQETHGNGANMDNLETHEERRVLPRTCFSVEPGIYLPEFGVRSEVNVFVDAAGKVIVTGGDPQTAVVAILKG